MKSTLCSCFCSLALALTALGQTPNPLAEDAPPATPAAPAEPVATPPVASIAVTPFLAPTPAPVATTAPAVAPSPAPDNEEDFDRAIERKIRKHFTIDLDNHHSGHDSDDSPWWIPLVVLIGCIAFFGTPVAIVGTILYFSFSKSRAMHKTVRMMVEKGQPVPEALLNPPPVIRQRSDLRRGIILSTVGVGLIVLLGALNDWDGGTWSIGMIPFLIGLGYLLVWRLDTHKEETSPKV